MNTFLKKLGALFLALAFLVAVPTASMGQVLQQSATRLDSTTNFGTVVASATTLTISPPAGQYVYVTCVHISNTVSGTAVTAAAQTTVTTTGLGGGTTPIWTVSSGTTAGAATQEFSDCPVTPIKSNTAGANVTVVTPTFATNQTIRVNVWYYFAS